MRRVALSNGSDTSRMKHGNGRKGSLRCVPLWECPQQAPSGSSGKIFSKFERTSSIMDTFPLTSHRERLPLLSEDRQCQFFILLDRVSCVADRTLHRVDSQSGQEDAQVTTESARRWCCLWCDKGQRGSASPGTLGRKIKQGAESFLSWLVQAPFFVESRKPRILAAKALGRIARHTDDPSFFDLETSSPGQWCLKAQRSSVNRLRLAAA